MLGEKIVIVFPIKPVIMDAVNFLSSSTAKGTCLGGEF
jgi:hypothetical protein